MIEQTSPVNVGLSAERLSRIAAHFDRYVDEGLLPGYLVLVARRGQTAYLHRYGKRDVEAGAPIEEDTIFRILLDDEADYVRRSAHAVRARTFATR